MNFKLLKKLFVVFFVPLQIFASEPLCPPCNSFEKIMGVIGQSGALNWFSKNIHAKGEKLVFDLLKCKPEQASSEKAKILAEEAQSAVGIIDKTRHLPLMSLPLRIALLGIQGITISSSIFVDENLFDFYTIFNEGECKKFKLDVGVPRCVLFHEAVHAKYHDSSLILLFNIFTAASAFTAAKYALQPISHNGLRNVLKCMIVAGTVKYSFKKITRFIENRADREGHYTTACAQCVRESAKWRELCKGLSVKDGDNLVEWRGYLSSSDLNKIANDLGEKRCAYHTVAH